MSRIGVIALNTFREAVRDRVLYLLLFFAGATILLSRVLSLLTVGDRVKVIMDVGLAALSFFGALMAILIGTSLVHKEIDKKTIYTLMSKPLHRFEFILGKFLGLALTLLVMISLMTVFFQIYILLLGGGFGGRVFLAALYIFLEMVLLTAVAILFSTFSTPILASLFSLSFFLIGHFSRGLQTLLSKVPAGFSRTALRLLYLFLPDLENFNLKTEVVHGLPLPAGFLVSAAAYGIVYTLFILTLAVVIFRRKDFT